MSSIVALGYGFALVVFCSSAFGHWSNTSRVVAVGRQHAVFTGRNAALLWRLWVTLESGCAFLLLAGLVGPVRLVWLGLLFGPISAALTGYVVLAVLKSQGRTVDCGCMPLEARLSVWTLVIPALVGLWSLALLLGTHPDELAFTTGSAISVVQGGLLAGAWVVVRASVGGIETREAVS